MKIILTLMDNFRNPSSLILFVFILTIMLVSSSNIASNQLNMNNNESIKNNSVVEVNSTLTGTVRSKDDGLFDLVSFFITYNVTSDVNINLNLKIDRTSNNETLYRDNQELFAKVQNFKTDYFDVNGFVFNDFNITEAIRATVEVRYSMDATNYIYAGEASMIVFINSTNYVPPPLKIISKSPEPVFNNFAGDDNLLDVANYWIFIDVAIQSSISLSFNLLFNQSGAIYDISYASFEREYFEGRQDNISVSFPVTNIGNYLGNGTLILSINFDMYDSYYDPNLYYNKIVYITTEINADLFGGNLFSIDINNMQYMPIDLDNNGLFDKIDITIPISFALTGYSEVYLRFFKYPGNNEFDDIIFASNIQVNVTRDVTLLNFTVDNDFIYNSFYSGQFSFELSGYVAFNSIDVQIEKIYLENYGDINYKDYEEPIAFIDRSSVRIDKVNINDSSLYEYVQISYDLVVNIPIHYDIYTHMYGIELPDSLNFDLQGQYEEPGVYNIISGFNGADIYNFSVQTDMVINIFGHASDNNGNFTDFANIFYNIFIDSAEFNPNGKFIEQNTTTTSDTITDNQNVTQTSETPSLDFNLPSISYLQVFSSFIVLVILVRKQKGKY